MSDIPLIISELSTPHLWLYTAPLFDGIITRKPNTIARTSVKVKNTGKRENQRQNLALKYHIYLH